MADEETDWRSVSDDSIEDNINNKKIIESFDFDDDIDVDLDIAQINNKNNKEDDDNDDDEDNNNNSNNNISDIIDLIDNLESKVRKSNSADDLLNINGNSTINNREESRSAGSNRAKTYSFDTEDSSTSGRHSTIKKTRKSVTRNWNETSNSQSPTPTPNTSVDKTQRSDESDEFIRGRFSSDDLSSPRYRLESFDNQFSFDDVDISQTNYELDDDDDDDDESFTYTSKVDHGLYSDPSDDEDEILRIKNPPKPSKLPPVNKENNTINNNNNNNKEKHRKKSKSSSRRRSSSKNGKKKDSNEKKETKKNESIADYFENDEDSNSNILPAQAENQTSMTLTNSVKSLHKATSVVVPVDDQDRPRTGSDKTRSRLGSDKDNEIRSPISASFSSTISSSISPEPMNRISAISPKSPPSMISEQLNDEIMLNSSSPQKTNKPSQLQVMASQRWNKNLDGSGSGSGSNFNSKKLKPSFAKFTEVHSFANAVKIVPDCDGALVLCATADSTVRLIDAITGKIISMFEGHSDRVLAVSINEKIPGHDDTIQYVVAGSRDENVCVWNFKTRACLQVLSGHDGAVWAVAVYVSLNGPPLAFSGSSDCSIRSWNILTGEVQHIFKGHSDTVLALTLYNGGQYTLSNDCRIISGGADHMVRVWDMSTGRHCRMLEGHTDDVNAVNVVEDSFGKLFRGVKIISGGRDRIIRVWDLERGTQIAEFAGHADCVYGVCGMVGKFSTLPGISTSKQKSVPAHLPHSTSTRGTVVGHLNRSSSVWLKQDTSNNLNDNLLPEIFLIISCSEDRTIKIWDVLGERLLITSKLHKGSVKGISLSPIALNTNQLNNMQSAAILLASCSWDKSVLFYDLDILLAGEQKKSCCTIS